jgi:hypothetical protein
MALVFSRRSVLAQLAAIPITAGFARNVLAQSTGASSQKNLIIFMQSHGTKRGAFWPPQPVPPLATFPAAYPIPATSLSTLPILNTLFTSDGVTDNGLKAKTNLFHGLQIVAPANNIAASQATVGFAEVFTGTGLINSGGAPFGGAISLDQMLSAYWDRPSLTTAVFASAVQANPRVGFNCLTSFSYVAPAVMHLPYVDPYKAYLSVFGTMPGAPGADYRLATRQSVLNAVSGDIKELQGRLGPDDGHKLDYHLNAIREVELRLQALLNMNAATCTGPMGSAPWFGPGVATGAMGAPTFEVNSEIYNDAQIQFMASLIGAAIRCRLARVASLQFGYGDGAWKFGWLSPANTLNPAAMPIGFNFRDAVAQRDGVDDMSNQPTANYVTWANQYYANIVRKVASDLLNAPDGEGNMLDNTLIIWANNLGRGDHQLTDLPIVFIGLVKNGISAGGRVIQYSPQTDHRVMGYHALNALGYDSTRFGAWNVPNLAFSGF